MLLQQTTVVQTTPSIGESVRLSLGQSFGAMLLWLPRLIAFLVIVLIGWWVSALLARIVGTLLRKIQFNEVAGRIGLGDFIARMRPGLDAAGLIAGAVKWLIRFVVLLVAFDALGLPAISDVLRQFLIWLPNLLVAIAVLVLAGVGARALGNLVRGTASEAEFKNPDTLANVAKTAVWIFAVVVAVNQVGIGEELVNTLFIGAVGAVSLAAGLAFGLGGRDLAAKRLDEWYEEGEDAANKVKDRNRGGASR